MNKLGAYGEHHCDANFTLSICEGTYKFILVIDNGEGGREEGGRLEIDARKLVL